MLMIDMRIRAENNGEGLLPNYNRVIIDEGHHLEDAATSMFRQQVSTRTIRRSLAPIRNRKDRPSALERIRGHVTTGLPLFNNQQQEALQLIEDLDKQVPLLWDLSDSWLQQIANDFLDEETVHFRLKKGFNKDPRWTNGLQPLLKRAELKTASIGDKLAKLDEICDLADTYDALVMVDECHAAGFIGETGRGTLEEKGVMGRVDIVTGTLGKALGGAMGGYTTGRKEIIEMLRQRSRPYLFSNSLAPAIVGASIKVFEMLENDTKLRDTLQQNTEYFKKGMKEAGFDIIDGDSAIVPVMLYDAKLSQQMADMLLEKGIYVIGFFYPVVPKGKARIRVQLSAAHTKEHLDKAIDAFTEVGKALNVV